MNGVRKSAKDSLYRDSPSMHGGLLFLVYLGNGYFFAKCNACLECLQDKIFSHQKNFCSSVLRVQFASKTCQAILCHILTCCSGMMSRMIRKVMQQPPLSMRKLLIIGCGFCRFQNHSSVCLQG